MAFLLLNMIFSKLQTGSNALLGQQWLPPCNTAMHTTFVDFSREVGFMNIIILRMAVSHLEVALFSLLPLHALLMEWSLLVDHSWER